MTDAPSIAVLDQNLKNVERLIKAITWHLDKYPSAKMRELAENKIEKLQAKRMEILEKLDYAQ